MNFTLPTTELESLTSFGVYLNTITNSLFWTLILVGIFMIAFIVLNRYTTVKAFLASSFMTFILSIFLFYTGLIVEKVFFFIFGAFILALIASYFID